MDKSDGKDRTTRAPVMETGVPVKFTRAPVIETGAPMNLIRRPLMETGVPLKFTRHWLIETGVPPKFTRVPVMETRAPLNLTRCRLKFTRRPPRPLFEILGHKKRPLRMPDRHPQGPQENTDENGRLPVRLGGLARASFEVDPEVVGHHVQPGDLVPVQFGRRVHVEPRDKRVASDRDQRVAQRLGQLVDLV